MLKVIKAKIVCVEDWKVFGVRQQQALASGRICSEYISFLPLSHTGWHALKEVDPKWGTCACL